MICVEQILERLQCEDRSPAAYLPQLHANSTVQLHQPGLQVHGLTVRVVEVDCGALVMVTLDLPQMHSQVITEFTELSFTGVLQAELKSCKNEQYTLRMLTNGDFTAVLNGIHICHMFKESSFTYQTRCDLSHIMSDDAEHFHLDLKKNEDTST